MNACTWYYAQHGTVKPMTRSILERYKFYRVAPESIQEQIELSATRICLKQGSHYFHKGEICKNLILPGDGSLRVFIDSDSRREATLYHVGPGETCPANLLSVLLAQRTPANAYCETALEAVTIPAASLQRWVAEVTAVREWTFEALAGRIVDVLARLEEMTFQRVDRRLAAYLLNRVGSADAESTTILMTHEQIANELGSAREVVSRLLKHFKQLGAIELKRGRIVLQNKQLLEQLCGDAEDE